MAAATKAKTNTAKANTHKSTVSNPSGGRRYHVGGGSRRKTNIRGRGASRSNRRRNPATGTTTTARRKTYRRNPSPTTNAALFAIGGALVVYGFDLLVGKLAPTISTPLRIGGAVAAGFAIGKWGKKYLGTWADIAQAALWFKAALDGWSSYIAPIANGYLGISSGTAIVAQQQVQNTQTGQLGTRLFLNDGNTVDVFNDQAAMAY